MAFSGVTLHLLEDVSERVSSTQLRSAAESSGRRLESLVGEPVAEYIRKTRLYRDGRQHAAPAQDAASSDAKKKQAPNKSR
jgi:hypothetical protein